MAVTGEDLVQVIWFAQPNDMIGGWCVNNVNKPASELHIESGEFCIADFCDETVARHIVEVHNNSLKNAQA